MSNAILYRMPSGVQGAVSREENKTIESGPLSATAFPSYGVPVKRVAGALTPIGLADVATAIIGLLVRPFPTSGGGSAIDTATPPTSGIGNVLRRGYMTVKNNVGTPAQDGQVYVWNAASTGSHVLGGIEATASQSVTSPAIVGTGTGTIAATVTGASAANVKAGTWVVTVRTTSNTSVLEVVDPDGLHYPDGKIGEAYKAAGAPNFTVTAGGTMTAGDAFSPVVTASTIAPAGMFFNGPADADGNVEVYYNI